MHAALDPVAVAPPGESRLALIRARLIAGDPGLLALRRAARGTLSFVLTLLLVWAASVLTGHPFMAFALGFPVSIFACIIVRENSGGARIVTTLWLVAASAAAFVVSALVTNVWANHLLFIALVFGVVYARRWGNRWSAAGFGAFTSFFFGAFLAPPPAALPWHMVGLALATAAALFVQFAVVPHRPSAGLDAAMAAIRQRLALLLMPFERFCGRGRWREAEQQRLRRELATFKRTVATAKSQLDAMDGGWRARSDLSFHLFEVEAAAERLVRLALTEGEGSCTPEAHRRASALRGWLGDGGRAPLALPPARGLLGEAMEELHDAVHRLRDARAAARRPHAAIAADTPESPKAAPQHGVTPQTRLAIQATTACALAIVGGELLSGRRWYWAVIAVFVMFSNTSSRGDALVKSLQRVGGTFAGVFAGIGLVALLGGDRTLELALLPVAIFVTFYFFTDRYSVMVFFLTVLLALLYAVLGRFTNGVLWLRVEETAIGAAAGILVSALLLPRTTRHQVRERFVELIGAAEQLVDASVARLIEGHGRSLGAYNRAFDEAETALRDAIRPLRLDRFGGGAALAGSVGDGLQSASYWMHELGLAGRGGAPADQQAGAALRWHQRRFHRRVERVRNRLAARAPIDAVDPDAGPALGRPARSPDERLDAAMRALRHLATALTHVGEAIGSGERHVRFFAY